MIKAQSRTMLCQSLELLCHPTLIEAQGAEWSGEMEGENSVREGSAIHMLCLYENLKTYENLVPDM